MPDRIRSDVDASRATRTSAPGCDAVGDRSAPRTSHDRIWSTGTSALNTVPLTPFAYDAAVSGFVVHDVNPVVSVGNDDVASAAATPR